MGTSAYPHKILTGRRDRIMSLRQKGGLSGFTKRSESEFDPFGAGHSSTLFQLVWAWLLVVLSTACNAMLLR